MKKLKVKNKNKFMYSKIDDKFEYLKMYSWYLGATGKYVMSCIDGKWVYLHKKILGNKKGCDIDHINGNRLDNRLENLRFCTRGQNMQNCFMKHNTSGYKGVSWVKRVSKWRAYIKYNQKQIALGLFSKKKEAAEVYNLAAIKYFGKQAWQNKI